MSLHVLREICVMSIIVMYTVAMERGPDINFLLHLQWD